MISKTKLRIHTGTILFLAAAGILTAILVYGLAMRWQFLYGVKGFRYAFADPFPLMRFLVPCLWALLAIFLFLRGLRKGSRWRHLFFILIAAYCFQISVAASGQYGITGPGLIVSDPAITSYFDPAAGMDEVPLDHYPDLMEQFFMHARTHPPGPVLFLKGIITLFEVSPVLTSLMQDFLMSIGVNPSIFTLNSPAHIASAFFAAFLLPLIGCFTAIPIYLFVSSIRDRSSAFIASTLFLFAPALALFYPEFDQTYSFLSMSAVLFGWLSFTEKKPLHALFSGFIIAICCFFQLLCLVVIGLILLAWIMLAWSKAVTFKAREVIWIAALFFTGIIVPFIVMKVVWGFSIIGVFRKAMVLNRVLVERFPPPGHDIIHFAIFTGVPAILLFLLALSSLKWIRPVLRPEGILTIAFLLVLVLISMSGQVRVETGRLFIFLMPFACCIAGVKLREVSEGNVSPIWVVFLLTILNTLALRATMAVLNSPIYGNF